MSIEERLDLIGEELEQAHTSDGSSQDITYINDTGYKLHLQYWTSASFETEDNDASYEDLHWRLDVVVIKRNEDGSEAENYTKSAGYAGSNNKQYDHHTWDTISFLENITLLPNQSLDVTSKVVVVTNGSGHSDHARGVHAKLAIIGAKEPSIE